MTRSEFEGLLARVEKATGPDRDLDASIAEATNDRPDWTKADDRELWPHEDGHVSLGQHGPSFAAPPYTASIDAAVALVERVAPDYWLEHVGEVRTPIRFVRDSHEPTGRWKANIQHWEGGRLETGEANSAALAILSALLRALLAQARRLRGKGGVSRI